MLYSKVDTLKRGDQVGFWDNTIGVVLNDGIKGKEFVEQYAGRSVCFYEPLDGIDRSVVNSNCAYSNMFEPGKEVIWYEVLLGDDKIWITDTQVDRPMITKL